MSVGFFPQSEPVSISLMIKVISISRCDVVVRVDAVVNALRSLGVMSVPARSDAWVRYGNVKILVVARSRAYVLRSLRVVDAVISGGRWSCCIGSPSASCGPVVAVHMHLRKSDRVVSSSRSGSVVRSLIRGGGRVDVVIVPFCLNLFAEIAIWVSLSNECCSGL